MTHPHNRIYVIGTTATGGYDYCQQLSKDRAKAVMDVLISFGIPESQMIPIGLGYEDPWHIDDIDENGRQVEEYACQNRKVLIIDENGDDALLLKDYINTDIDNR